MSSKAPQFPFRVLRWFCDPEIVEDISGDLTERFERQYQYRKLPALLLMRDVVLLFRPGIIRPIRGTQNLSTIGLLSYFLKIGWRNIRQIQSFSFVNIIGLSLALASAFLIHNYVEHERQTDAFFSQKGALYRLVRHVHDGNVAYQSPLLSATYKGDLVNKLGIETENLVRIIQEDELVTHKNNSFFEAQFFYTDPSFFTLLDYPFLYGDRETALHTPNSVVISQQVALKYFGKENTLGEVLEIDNKGLLQVTGILASVSQQSHLTIDLIAPISGMGYTSRILKEKEAHAFSYYLLSDKPPLPIDLSHASGQHQINWQALNDVYFDESLEEDFVNHGNSNLNQSLTFIAIVILLMAGANFLNLALCAFLRKIKNLGVRKAIGSSTSLEILKQFIEYYLTLSIAMLMSLVISFLSTETLLKSFAHPIQWQISFAWRLPLIALIVALPITIYTSTIISGTRATQAMAKKVRLFKIRILQEGVLTFQFVVVIVLMAMSLVLARQYTFMQEKELGLNPDQILYFNSNNKHSYRNAAKIKEEIAALPGVEDIAMSTGGLPYSYMETSRFLIQGISPQMLLTTIYTSPNFPSLMEMNLIEGDLFNPSLQSSATRNAILNETAARQLGWPQEQLLGKSASSLDILAVEEEKPWKIIGIVKDFHSASLQESIKPMIMLSSDQEESFVIKLATAQSVVLVEDIATIWETYVPKYPFVYHFLDQQFERLHQKATNQRKLLYIFLGLTIAIALFGTLGLSTYFLQIRRKELALRSVFGAPMHALTFLISFRYAKILLIAATISLPLSLYFSNVWLNDFSYRINFTVDLFLASAGSVMVLIIGVIGLQVKRSLQVNLINELSDE